MTFCVELNPYMGGWGVKGYVDQLTVHQFIPADSSCIYYK